MTGQERKFRSYAATFPAEPAVVQQVRAEVASVASQCDLSRLELDDVRLAVSEVVTNAIVHAYAGTSGEIRVRVDLVGSDLHVVIADDGGGMAPRVGSPGLGLGLPTVAAVTKDMEVVSPEGGGTEVHLRFACRACAGAA